MSAVNDTLEEVSRAVFGLLLKEPFYAHVLAGMRGSRATLRNREINTPTR